MADANCRATVPLSRAEYNAALRAKSAGNFTCEHCGAAAWRKISGTNQSKGIKNRFCCMECRKGWKIARLAAEKESQRKAQAIRRLVRAIAQAGKIKAIAVLRCLDCDVAYEHQKYRRIGRCPACSDAAVTLTRRRANEAYRASELGRKARRVRKSREKAVRRMRIAQAAESIDPIKVFERDRWACQMCGIKTPKALRGTNDPKAPELDHVVALALGGSHTWANVQCACRRCNGLKGAKALGQLGFGFAA